ncbi:hypothetical protein B9Z19DRAFT_1134327 [Tuber borchii]|uniref:Uncharacterized protein n=1 Tax=Tuber borchii TaxID=42251 RepID=A0A2T6ZEB2_TUBBO|nr:hypothetical protein B9Z19DRAFT_1134327 [Tuber borchii]
MADESLRLLTWRELTPSQRWPWLATPLRLLEKIPGFNIVVLLIAGKMKHSQQEEEDLDNEQRELMHHIEAIEQNIREIQQQLLDHLPSLAVSYPQHSPGTWHQFQQIIMLLHDIQGHGAGNASGTRPALSPEDRKQFQEENLLHDKNNLARLINSKVTVSTMPLEPLYGADGKPIPNFPETGADIKKLKGRAINNLLLALGLSIDGALEDRRKRFMKYIGFTMLLY